MNQELQHALASLLEKLQQGADWTVGQMPDAIRQWMGYNAWLDKLWLCFDGFFLVVGISLFGLFCYLIAKDENDDALGFCFFTGLGLVVLFGIGIVVTGADLYEISHFPKAWILDNIHNLTGK